MNLEHRSNLPHSGPLGPIARTAEYDNNDAADNRDTYYLRDGMGGSAGLLTDEDDNLATPQQFSFSTYDAFGNHMSPGRPSSQGGSFAWRGAEGSVYDSHPTLVYMQARHYDPTIGRFIQPDTLALGSMTTQGMNRYIYCENDPVNHSDPSGKLVGAVFAILFFAALAGAVNSFTGGSGGFWAGFVGALIAGAIGALGPLGIVVGSAIGSGVTSAWNGDSRQNFVLSVTLGMFFGSIGGILGKAARELATKGNRVFLSGLSLADEADLLFWEIHFAAIGADMEFVSQCFLP